MMTETYPEWLERVTREKMDEYNCTRADAEDCMRNQEYIWIRAVEAAAACNDRLHDRVLDSYCRTCGEAYYLSFFRGNAEQEGYMVPSVRKQQKQIYIY